MKPAICILFFFIVMCMNLGWCKSQKFFPNGRYGRSDPSISPLVEYENNMENLIGKWSFSSFFKFWYQFDKYQFDKYQLIILLVDLEHFLILLIIFRTNSIKFQKRWEFVLKNWRKKTNFRLKT